MHLHDGGDGASDRTNHDEHSHRHPGGSAHHPVGNHGHVHQYAHQNGGILGILGQIFHRHQHVVIGDEPLEATAAGTHTLLVSLVVLGATGGLQLVIALSSGSVGLLADTIHNFSDALTALPLWLAFLIGRRPSNRRYTYGYGRAEDVAGLAIVLLILASAVVALGEAYQKLVHPAPLHQAGWVVLAALVGFLGNEVVASMRIRTGQQIGSAALEADGHHARIDGLTSLSVLVGAVAVVFGLPIADPIVGILISVAILFVGKDAAVSMWHRLMDAVDPALVECAEDAVAGTPGVRDVHDLHLRWVGHRLLADLRVTVDEDLSIGQAHAIAEDARHRLFHAIPRLADAWIHVDPCGHSGIDHHETTAHHRPI